MSFDDTIIAASIKCRGVQTPHEKTALPARRSAGAKPKSHMSRSHNTMKTTIITALFFCCAGFSSQLVNAQQQQTQTSQESFPHRYVSLGIRAAGIQVSDLASNAYPTTRLVLASDPNDYFRIEIQYGLYNRKHEVNGSQAGSSGVELEDKSSFIGFGIMGMYPKDRGRFIGGLRYSLNNYSDEELEFGAGSSVIKNTGKMKLLTGTIGGEYFLARFFSVGAEFCVSSVTDDYESGEPGSSTLTTKTLLTEGNLIFRFYPF